MVRYLFLAYIFLVLFFSSCDHIDRPFISNQGLELDSSLYPGNWADYVNDEWPTFLLNTNLNRNVLIEDYTGHQCVFCPAAADLAHALHGANPTRVFTASIHAGPQGSGDFQVVAPPDYPVDFTNSQGLDIATYFGLNDGGFSGNPRGTINRTTNGGVIFQSPTQWTSITNSILSNNILGVNMQAALNYYASTKGAFLHLEIDKLDPNITNELGVVVYVIEDSLVGDQKMSDNSHNSSYVHRDIHRGNLNNQPFGRVLSPQDVINGKYYLNYSFLVPNQLDGAFNASNMHILAYVYDKVTWEIYQVVKKKITP